MVIVHGTHVIESRPDDTTGISGQVNLDGLPACWWHPTNSIRKNETDAIEITKEQANQQDLLDSGETIN